MSEIQFSLEYITVQGGLPCWLVSLFQIGSATLMIDSSLQVMFSTFVLDLSLGLVRNNMILFFIQRKESIEKWLMQVRKPYGFDKSFQSLDSSSSIQPPFGVTIRVPSSSLNIQFNINTSNTSSYTCTSLESSFMIKLLKCFVTLQKFKL
jgi:hypothetical protein